MFETKLNTKFQYALFKFSNLPIFKGQSLESYKLFRTYFEIIDFISLDLDYMYYMDRYLCLSVMYFSIGINLNVFTNKDISENFQQNINEISLHSFFNEIFNTFLEHNFSIGLDSLIGTLKFITKFYCLNFDCSFPQKSVLNIPEKEKVILTVLKKEDIRRIPTATDIS